MTLNEKASDFPRQLKVSGKVAIIYLKPKAYNLIPTTSNEPLILHHSEC